MELDTIRHSLLSDLLESKGGVSQSESRQKKERERNKDGIQDSRVIRHGRHAGVWSFCCRQVCPPRLYWLVLESLINCLLVSASPLSLPPLSSHVIERY